MVYCAYCGIERVTGDLTPCPSCGKEPYPHKTTAVEFAEKLEIIAAHDTLGQRLEQEQKKPKSP